MYRLMDAAVAVIVASVCLSYLTDAAPAHHIAIQELEFLAVDDLILEVSSYSVCGILLIWDVFGTVYCLQ